MKWHFCESSKSLTTTWNLNANLTWVLGGFEWNLKQFSEEFRLPRYLIFSQIAKLEKPEKWTIHRISCCALHSNQTQRSSFCWWGLQISAKFLEDSTEDLGYLDGGPLEEISTQNGHFNFNSNSMSSCVSQWNLFKFEILYRS